MIHTILTLSFLISTIISGTYKVNPELSFVEVDGTSTLHDWTIQAKELKTVGTLTFSENGINVSNVVLTIPVKSLESGKSAMNDNTYSALKASKYPNIVFKLNEFKTTDNKNFTANGALTISGTTKNLSPRLTVTEIAGNKVQLKGSISFKMSSFGVEPPTVMFGTISTGDEVTIRYNVVLNK